MLRITVDTRPERATMRLEGRIAGPWVDELAGCWQRLLASREAHSVRIDLDGVTFVDARGREVLDAMQKAGAVLVATVVMMRALVEEIARAGAASSAAADGDTKE